MKKLIVTISFIACSFTFLQAQELPVLTQKFTNAFYYNPAVAGLEEGSVDMTFQRLWGGLDRTVNNSYFMAQSPLMAGNIGVGLQIFNEKINLFNTLHLKASGAYHLPLSFNSTLSFGLSAEYGQNRLDQANVNVREVNDPLILNYPGFNNFDFSFGANFRSNYFQIGGSVNRIMTFLEGEQDTQDYYLFPEFVTAQASFFIPVAFERDILEPRLNYRTVAPSENLFDVGLFYTYNNLLTFGGAYRTNNTYNVSAAVHFQQFTLGYSRQSFSNEFASDIGGSDEITLRYVFTYNENGGFFGGSLFQGGSFWGDVPMRKAKKPRKPITSDREKRKMKQYKGKYKKLLKKNN